MSFSDPDIFGVCVDMAATQNNIGLILQEQGKLPEALEMIQTALNTGAHGCWISGAGPTIMALTGGHGGTVDGDSISTVEALEVSKALGKVAQDAGMGGRVLIAEPSTDGIRYVDSLGRKLQVPKSIIRAAVTTWDGAEDLRVQA